MNFQFADDFPYEEIIFGNEESQLDIDSNISKNSYYSEDLDISYIINQINDPKNQDNKKIEKEAKIQTQKELTQKMIEKSEDINVKYAENSENCFKKENEKKENDENDEGIKNEDNEVNDKKLMFSILNEKLLKIGNYIKKKSCRRDNLNQMIIRNLIQEILLDWINYGETDNSKKLCKINPQIFRKKYDFRGKKLKEIYSKEISKKEKEKHSYCDNHNILIIKSAYGIKNIKLNLTFKQALHLFFCKNNAIKNISDIIQIDENEEDVFLEGLKGKEEYINRKGGNSLFKKNLIKALEKMK